MPTATILRMAALIEGAKVTAEIVEQRKDKKVIAFKFAAAKAITERSVTDAS